MRLGSLSAELDAITHEFDYGIVPGSATVFVRDEINNIGRLDLTLLEGVMIVLEVTDQGYRVTSCSPLCNVDPALSTSQTVEAHLEAPFESMESLLMAISPMFRDRFQQELYNKLQCVQQQQQQQQHQQQQQQNTQPIDLIGLQHPSQQHEPVFNTEQTQTSNQTNKRDTTTTNHLDSFDELNKWMN